MTDPDLHACVRGDKRAWDVLVDRCSGIVFAAVRRTIGRQGGGSGGDEIEDVVQDVFVRLVKNDYRLLKSFDPQRASLSTWLTLVARSTAIDHLRRRRPDPAPLHPATPASPDNAEPDLPEIPMHVLTARQRLVLKMLFEEDMTVAEAAAMLGVDDQTIRSTKHKALSRLREHLAATET